MLTKVEREKVMEREIFFQKINKLFCVTSNLFNLFFSYI